MNGTFPCRMFVNKLNKAEWNRVVLSILWVFPVASFFLVVIHLTKGKKRLLFTRKITNDKKIARSNNRTSMTFSCFWHKHTPNHLNYSKIKGAFWLVKSTTWMRYAYASQFWWVPMMLLNMVSKIENKETIKQQ